MLLSDQCGCENKTEKRNGRQRGVSVRGQREVNVRPLQEGEETKKEEEEQGGRGKNEGGKGREEGAAEAHCTTLELLLAMREKKSATMLAFLGDVSCPAPNGGEAVFLKVTTLGALLGDLLRDGSTCEPMLLAGLTVSFDAWRGETYMSREAGRFESETTATKGEEERAKGSLNRFLMAGSGEEKDGSGEEGGEVDERSGEQDMTASSSTTLRTIPDA